MKLPSIMPKNKWARRLAVLVLLVAVIGIGVRANASSQRDLPIAVFDPRAADVKDSQQVILVRSKGWLDTTATLEGLELTDTGWRTVIGPIPARLGRTGFAQSRHEGDGSTPAGVFTVTEGFGSQAAPTNTKIDYKQTQPVDWWVSDPDSPITTPARARRIRRTMARIPG